MNKRICVDVSMKEKLRDFIETEKIKLEIVTGEPADVQVLFCAGEERHESSLDTIYSGGWVVCETARGLAGKMGISLNQMGKLLNHLNVKIRRCSLGCFG